VTPQDKAEPPPAFALGELSQALPPGAAGQWCAVSVRVPGDGAWWAQLELTDAARGQVVRDCFFGPRRGFVRAALVHVPAESACVVVRVYGAASDGAVVRVRRLRRGAAALALLWRGRGLIWAALRGDARGRLGRLRAVLGQAPARRGEAPPYAAWITLCEAALPPPGAANAPDWAIAVTGDGPGLAATLESLRMQSLPGPAPVLVHDAAGWGRLTAPWIVLLRAGEVLAPDALAWLALAVQACPAARFVTADCDFLTPDGTRRDPAFKPVADSVLLRTEFPAWGVAAVRDAASLAGEAPDAHAARCAAARRHPNAIVRVPRILTHFTESAAPAPPRPVAIVRDPAFVPTVTMLAPSALRSAHAENCLRRVLRGTNYSRFALNVVVSDAARADRRLIRRLGAWDGARIETVDINPFNYAAVNNAAAARADGELLLLLNDDVAPMRPDWLSAMVAHMQDPGVGIVGARLFYGNGMVQHEGVVMGRANLCEHAGRLSAPGDDGPHGIGGLDREVSAVTGACLLIRAALYRALGGMDESFAIALNDVDLCLRARRAGWRVVYCAQAALWHYESLSLGRHYAGERAALEALEVRRLSAAWPGAIDADPFYNPQASLEPGREWRPGFPPRSAGLAWGAANPAATGY
jgi:GT2 family glycosyltransferase